MYSKNNPSDIIPPVRIVSKANIGLEKFFYEFVRINDMLPDRYSFLWFGN